MPNLILAHYTAIDPPDLSSVTLTLTFYSFVGIALHPLKTSNTHLPRGHFLSTFTGNSTRDQLII